MRPAKSAGVQNEPFVAVKVRQDEGDLETQPGGQVKLFLYTSRADGHVFHSEHAAVGEARRALRTYLQTARGFGYRVEVPRRRNNGARLYVAHSEHGPALTFWLGRAAGNAAIGAACAA